MQLPESHAAHIAAFVNSVAYKFEREAKASVFQTDSLTTIAYTDILEHPWPREFSYSKEVFAYDARAEVVVDGIRDQLETPKEEHVLSVLGPDEERIVKAYSALGYAHAWTNVLMHRHLAQDEDSKTHVVIRRATSSDDIEQINALRSDFSTSVSTLEDADLHNYVAVINGWVVANAQVVTCCAPFAYVSDMFTEPNSRRKGLGSALLSALHAEVKDHGAEEMILVPSIMARQSRFYEGRGYDVLVPMVLLTPAVTHA